MTRRNGYRCFRVLELYIKVLLQRETHLVRIICRDEVQHGNFVHFNCFCVEFVAEIYPSEQALFVHFHKVGFLLA